MRPFTSTISLDEAHRQLDAAVRSIDRSETIPLANAAGRVAAQTVTSSIDVPPFSRSAMDGYAVIAADTTGASRSEPRMLRMLDRIFTGAPSRARVSSGTCAEIATGAPLPDGADAVVMVEETARDSGDSGRITFFVAAASGQNIGRRGADIATGAVVVRTGDLLTPARVGALAAIGWTSIAAFAKPRVAILSTGNEVVEPGHRLAPGQIYDVNGSTLASVVTAHGGIAERHHAAEDTIEALDRALDRAAGADIIVFSGGSSVGERDLIIDAVRSRGEVVFHGIAVKPGKPTLFARIGDSRFFGMPGNPTSCLSNAYILLVPFLRATARLPVYVPDTRRLALARTITSAGDRHQFFTVRIRDGAAHPAFKGSGEITSLSEADGYIEIPVGQRIVEAGTLVDVKLF